MANFALSQYHNSSVIVLYTQRRRIDLDPSYQRDGGVWTLSVRQLLLDSIINGFDIPKFYFHEFVPPERGFHYAIIDGKQRLQTIWDFMDNRLTLASDFTVHSDQTVEAGGMTYDELARKYPTQRAIFDAYHLDVVNIRTEGSKDLNAIEDMFSRLNEATPLNAPEKRNAFGGPLPPLIKTTADHRFFRDSVYFKDRRYRHRDLATKALWLQCKGAVVNTKKGDLDGFVKSYRRLADAGAPEASAEQIEALRSETWATLDLMAETFGETDRLLRQVGMITLYFHLYRYIKKGQVGQVGRSELEWFEKARDENRRKAEQEDPSEVDQDLTEFDKHSQTPNDAYALRIRLHILLRRLRSRFRTRYSSEVLSESV